MKKFLNFLLIRFTPLCIFVPYINNYDNTYMSLKPSKPITFKSCTYIFFHRTFSVQFYRAIFAFFWNHIRSSIIVSRRIAHSRRTPLHPQDYVFTLGGDLQFWTTYFCAIFFLSSPWCLRLHSSNILLPRPHATFIFRPRF